MTTNILVGDIWVSGQQLARQVDQRRVLGIGERQVVRTFQLDPKGKIVAHLAPLEAGDTGMPGPVAARNKLRHSAVTFNQKMRRHP